jgi:hypothetical protein
MTSVTTSGPGQVARRCGFPLTGGCVWIAADPPRVSAVAVWLAQGAEQPLVLCDEGYSEDLELEARSEDEILSWMLRAAG